MEGMMRLQRKQLLLDSQECKQRKASTTSFSKERTNRLITKKKVQNFGEIFEKLDSDEDGRISAFKIDITSLDAKQLQVLTPLFVEMEELGMTLERDEFIEAANRLYVSVSLPDKKVLIEKSTTR